jgi:hypothetical protein
MYKTRPGWLLLRCLERWGWKAVVVTKDSYIMTSSSSVFLANSSTTDDAKMIAFCKISEMPAHAHAHSKEHEEECE